jgi:LuxR family maltose regulon positive regulatory protein
LNYLTEEVLERQPEEIRRFLLQTSILDRQTGELCDAVTGRTDSAALLEGLLAANLFLLPLDDERRWYRYHQLFAGLLRNLGNRRQWDQAVELHRRARHWYADAGLSGEAMHHEPAAADCGAAVRLLEKHATGLIVEGNVSIVEGWLQAIPVEMRDQSPGSTWPLPGCTCCMAPMRRPRRMWSDSGRCFPVPCLQKTRLCLPNGWRCNRMYWGHGV